MGAVGGCNRNLGRIHPIAGSYVGVTQKIAFLRRKMVQCLAMSEWSAALSGSLPVRACHVSFRASSQVLKRAHRLGFPWVEYVTRATFVATVEHM